MTTTNIRRLIEVLAFMGIAGIIFSCSPKNIVPKNQYLLKGQSFKGNNAITTEALDLLLPQRPNSNLFLIPGATVRLWVYQWQEPRYLVQKKQWQTDMDSLNSTYESQILAFEGTSKKTLKVRGKYIKKQERILKKINNGNLWMRFLGSEPPVYYNEIDTKKNIAKIKDYLTKEGYRQAQVSAQVDTMGRNIRVLYNIKEGIPYKLLNVNILTDKDAVIDSLLSQTKQGSYLKVGENYRDANVQTEAYRIINLMRDNGYFGFSEQYLKAINVAGKKHGGFIIDTTQNIQKKDSLGYRAIDVKRLEINYPRNQSQHNKYHYGPISFKIESPSNLVHVSVKKDTITKDGIEYIFDHEYFSPKILKNRVLMRTGSLVRDKDIAETKRQLSLVDQFEFIKIDNIDTTAGVLRPVIRVIPRDKHIWQIEPSIYVVESSPGFFFNTNTRTRNVFGNLENLDISGRFAYDLQPGYIGIDTLIQTIEVGLNASLVLPQILLPNRWVESLSHKTPKTIISLGLNYSRHLPDFARGGFRANMTYNWKKSDTEFITISPIDISFIRTSAISNVFSRELNRLFEELGNPLKYSFQDRAVVSSISGSYLRNNIIPNKNQKGEYLRLFAESGGTTLNLISKILNNYEVYKFLKVNAEYRVHYPLRKNKNSTVVYRFNGGLLWSYGSNRAAPYEKYFTAGGSNSMRAWQARRVGLGAAYPSTQTIAGGSTAIPRFRNPDKSLSSIVPTDPSINYGRFDYRFEQLGDLLLETNVELRGRILRFLGGNVNYATFLDIGNVWKLPRPTDKSDANAQNAVFSFNKFFSQLAVGTGVGIRYDMSFFVLRLDAGIKVWDPARKYSIVDQAGKVIETRDERFMLPKISFFNSSSANFAQYQIGIGYPF